MTYNVPRLNGTHTQLTLQGIAILRNDMGNDLVGCVFINDGGEDWHIAAGSYNVDDEEKDLNTYKGHFYDPDTQKNYLDGYEEACQRFVHKYYDALKDCKNHVDGWKYKLGQALHYLQDATCPFHAANDIQKPLIDGDHCKFEKYAEEHFGEMKTSTSDLYAVATASNFPVLSFPLQLAAFWAKDTYKRYNLTNTEEQWAAGAKESLINSQKWTAAILYRFMLESGIRLPRHLLNIALGKPASQSSTYTNLGKLTPQYYRIRELDEQACAAKAVDGCTNGNFSSNTVTHTNMDNKAWWQVDLETMYQIGRIEIYNRTDCCKERLKDFRVAILNQNQEEIWSNPHIDSGDSQLIRIDVPGVNGRFVKIQLNGTNYLHLAEVKVFQTPG